MADVFNPIDAGAGTPQTSFVPDAARQATVAQAFFYTLGDIFGGSDVSARVQSPNGNAVDVAVAIDGTPYVRGTTYGLPTNSSASAPPATGVMGFNVTPGMVLAGLVAVFLITRGK
jgi:ABC-type uncharacterized transport system permease subunit